MGILQRDHDHAVSVLSSSPLLSGLFISYVNRAVALESTSATSSPKSEEWGTLRATITSSRDENEKLRSEAREVAEKLRVAEVSREAFCSQVSSLKEVNATQQNDIKHLWAALFGTEDKYDQLVVDSNARAAALQVPGLGS